jgi:hypothetical protein
MLGGPRRSVGGTNDRHIFSIEGNDLRLVGAAILPVGFRVHAFETAKLRELTLPVRYED